ncbi:PstC family ABC transporter permease [Thiothrix subterranea]|uniref:PstC family ABC transporter permease n=1 Tax=Thiothrix subterranea TaxID=2735563 RepID=UPI00280BD50F|nr:phosphate ABC transporter permease family protein [Thiothrix subterranea]
MSTLGILLTLTVLAAFSYYIGRKRSLALATPVKRGGNDLHSLPSYYGYLVVIWAIIPALLVFVLWSSLEKPLLTSSMMSHLPAEYQDKSADELSLTTNRIHNLADDPAQMATAEPVLKAAAEEYQQMRSMSQNIKTLLVLALAIAGIFIGLRYVKPKTRARNQVERVVQFLMIGCASIAILTTVGIVFSVLLESYRFFGHVPATDFLFGTHWSPQTAMRADQAGSSGAFGAVPLFVGTLLISFIALLVAVPLGLMSAIYLSEYAGPNCVLTRNLQWKC